MDEDEVLGSAAAVADDPVMAATPTPSEARTLDRLVDLMERQAADFGALRARMDRVESSTQAGTTGRTSAVAAVGAPVADSQTLAQRLEAVERAFATHRAESERIIRGIVRRSSLGGAEDVATRENPELRFDIVRALKGHLTGWANWNPAHPEKDIVHEYGRQLAGWVGRDTQSTFMAPLGGFLVPPEHMTEMIEVLQAKTVVIRGGARVIPLIGSPATWPKGKGGATASWTPELAAPTKTNVRFGQLLLTPKPLTCVLDVSEDLIFQTSGRATNLVQNDMGRAMGEKLDIGALKGTHSDGEPLGLVNQPGINATSWSGLDYTGVAQNITVFLDNMIFGPMSRNAYFSNEMVWLMNPLTTRALRRLRNDLGQPMLFDPGVQGIGQPAGVRGGGFDEGIMWGHRFLTTTQLLGGTSADDLIFGALSQMLVGNWGPFEVAASNQNSDNFEKSVVTLKMRQKVDVGVRHVEAFQIATGLDATIVT